MEKKLILPYILQNIFWLPGMILLVIFGRLRITGKENLNDLSGPLIFTSNHTCELDGILILSTFHPLSRFIPLIFVSRESSFYSPTFFKKILFLGNGTVFQSLGAHPAIVGLNDFSKSLKVHADFLRSGHRVCIFPEGKIISSGLERKAKGGIGYLAISTGATVIPFHIEGTRELNWYSFFTFQHHITVRVLPKMSFQNHVLKNNLNPEECKKTAGAILSTIYDS